VNWAAFRSIPWIDTRAKFVAQTPQGGNHLDIGSSDGETLNHFSELRPDLNFFATDLEGAPDRYPSGCQFHRGDIQRDQLPWKGESFHSISCMHLVEHIAELDSLFQESARLLATNGRIYFETPHPKTLGLSSPQGAAAGTFTMNFYDDPTHVKPVPVGILAQHARRAGLEVVKTGISRNLLFVCAYPFSFFFADSRKKLTSRAHFLGWSAYLIARKP